MKQGLQLCLFTLDERCYALTLSCVERVVFVVDITPLPTAPPVVLGIVNVKGDIVPVYDTRRRFRLPEREIHLTDQLMIARTSRQTVALLVDSVDGVVEIAKEDVAAAREIIPEIECVQGVVKLQDGLALIHDLEQFLSAKEEQILDEALKNASGAQGSVSEND
jgi:purine-binding chemotaxis protein CheW